METKANFFKKVDQETNIFKLLKESNEPIAALWSVFNDISLQGAPDMQKSECRKYFYTGFNECIRFMLDAVEYDDDVSTNGLAVLIAELEKFREEE